MVLPVASHAFTCGLTCHPHKLFSWLLSGLDKSDGLRMGWYDSRLGLQGGLQGGYQVGLQGGPQGVLHGVESFQIDSGRGNMDPRMVRGSFS